MSPTGQDTPEGDRFELVIGEEEQSRRLDQILVGRLELSRAQVQERIAGGRVLVDGVVAAKSLRMTAGQRVLIEPEPPPAAPGPAPGVPIRWQDDHLVVVAKPSGLVVHPGAGTRDPTLVDALGTAGIPLAPGDDPDRPGIVHRLDRGTSGVLVVAKTDQALEGLKRLFSTHDVERRYWVLVDGVPATPRATIDAPIGRSTTNRTRFAVDPQGRPAVTHYDVTVDHGRAAELLVRLETGRTHQVRVHLSAIGHPVVADRVYGAGGLGVELGLDRPALHAGRLGFDHPVTGERVVVDEPLPADLLAARDLLTGMGR